MAEETRAEKARRIARERIAAGESKVVQSSFEVSTKGNQLGKEFSALNATFKEGIFAGKTIEEVWQNDIKKSGKGRPPTQDSILFGKPIEESKRIYQQLWQKWANENPDKILKLKKIVDQGTKLTDSFAGNPDRTVNQAEALTNVIKNTNIKIPTNIDINKIINNPSFIDGIESHTEFFMEIKNKLELQGFKEKDVDNVINKYMDEIADSPFLANEFNPNDIEEAGSFVREYTRPKSIEKLKSNADNFPLTKIISGLQKNVDQYGIEAAKELGLDYGGTVNRGFKVVPDGNNSPNFEEFKTSGNWEEIDSQYYPDRTKANAQNGDGTVWFGEGDSRGYGATKREVGVKPWIENPTSIELREWIIDNNIKTLNVAGNRSYGTEELGEKAKNTIVNAVENTKPPTNVVDERLRLERIIKNNIENPRLQEGLLTRYLDFDEYVKGLPADRAEQLLDYTNKEVTSNLDLFKNEFNKQPPYNWPLSEDLETIFFDYEEPSPIEDARLADIEGWDLDADGNPIDPRNKPEGMSKWKQELSAQYDYLVTTDTPGGSLGAAKLNDPNVFTDAAMIVPDVKISKLLKNKAKLLAIDGINALDVYEIGLILGALIEPGVEKALNPIMPILFPGIDKEKIKDNKSYKEQVIKNLQITSKISPTDIALDKYSEKNSSKLGMDSIVMTQLTPNIGRVPRKIKKSRYNKDYNWIEGLING